jgi:DNA-binding winged helix-turn-helix (wHTH) protein
MKRDLEQGPIRIGEFQLDSTAQRLWRNEEPIDLAPQVWAVLTCLVERAGQLVTKEEILRSAWPGVVVSDMALSQAVRRLRAAFGDEARAPRYIETAHRRGFRLIAPIGTEPSEGRVWTEPALFVGRDTERRRLAELLEAARREVRQTVFIEGEAGIGKTALLRSFLAEQTGGEVRLAAAQCVEQQGSAEPYMPVLEALDRLARSSRETLDALRRYAPTWLVQMPWLLAAEEARELRSVVGEATRARMLREMTRALEVLSAARPLVIVLEDLHWADAATLDLLASIARRRDAARLMILGTYRPTEAIAYQHPIVALVRALWAGCACTRLGLAPLGLAEVEAYLSKRFSAPRLAASLARGICERSEGNPLFLVAMVDHLMERGFLVEGGGRWRLARSIEDDDLREIPTSLREMIELQLASLDPRELELLRAASVAAVEFRSASVAAALDRPGPEGIEAVESACDRLIARRHLLRAAGDQTWPDGTRAAAYAFRHQLYRQALYEQLPHGRRRRLHQRIGERLEQGFANDLRRVAAELALHFEQSSDDAKAIAYFVLAARQAHRRFADREAAQFLRTALGHLGRLPADPARNLNELQIRVGIVLAHWLAELERPEEDEQHVARIQEFTRDFEGPESFSLCHRLWTVYSFRSLPDLAAPFADRLIAIASSGERAQRMEASIARGMTALMQGKFMEATDDETRALEAYGTGDPPDCAGFSGYETKWEDAGVRVHGYLGMALLLSGALDRASTHLKKAIDLCAGRLHPKHAAAAYISCAGLFTLLGDIELAGELSDRGLAIAEEHTLPSLLAAASPQRAWLAIESGAEKEPGSLIRGAWNDYLRGRSGNPAAVGPLLLADACHMAGMVDEGMAVVETVWRDTRQGGPRWHDAELRRLEGELILLRGRGDGRAEAARRFRSAVEIARAQGAWFHGLRAATSLARLCRGHRNEREARATLEHLYSRFSEGLSTPALRSAAECLGPEEEGSWGERGESSNCMRAERGGH